ncbi:MAG: ABC transporter ATP-binding protein [Lachnospiraceae bacterium]
MMIVIKNLTKSFGSKKIINHFSLEIKKGEMIGLVGPSGCGKSTLLNIIGTLDKNYDGKIYIDGKLLTKNNKQSLLIRKKKLGYLFQNFALLDSETVETNLKIVSADSKQMKSVLKKLGLQDKLKDKIYTLSGGEQQRVAMARLMLKDPEIILADEPTGSLDKNNEKIIFDILQEFQKSGKTIIVVTHEDEVLNRFDRVIKINA